VDYCRLETTSSLPELTLEQPFKAVIVADTTATPEQKEAVARWLVGAGCLYMMAWGLNCRSWQDAINLANLQAFDFGTVPDDKLIITTAHEHEAIEDVFWFSKHTAMHPCCELTQTLLLHWSHNDRQAELADIYESA
jgi:hypothetical protein